MTSWTRIGIAGCLLSACGNSHPNSDAGVSIDAFSDASAGPVDAIRGADAGPADAAPPQLEVSGLVMWLDGDRGVLLDETAGVVGWRDQSGRGHDMVTAAPYAPTVTTVAEHGGFHFPFTPFGEVAPSFRAFSALGGELDVGTEDLYVAVVAAFDSFASSRSTFFCYSITGAGDGLVLRGNGLNGAFNTAGLSVLGAPLVDGQYQTNLNVEAPYNDGVARVYALQRVAGTTSLRVDGVVVGSQEIGTNADLSGEVTIELGTQHGIDSLDGDLAEVVMIRGDLTVTDRTMVEDYLRAKYGRP